MVIYILLLVHEDTRLFQHRGTAMPRRCQRLAFVALRSFQFVLSLGFSAMVLYRDAVLDGVLKRSVLVRPQQKRDLRHRRLHRGGPVGAFATEHYPLLPLERVEQWTLVRPQRFLVAIVKAHQPVGRDAVDFAVVHDEPLQRAKAHGRRRRDERKETVGKKLFGNSGRDLAKPQGRRRRKPLGVEKHQHPLFFLFARTFFSGRVNVRAQLLPRPHLFHEQRRDRVGFRFFLHILDGRVDELPG